jgi:hypothetical protein
MHIREIKMAIMARCNECKKDVECEVVASVVEVLYNSAVIQADLYCPICEHNITSSESSQVRFYGLGI